MAPPPDVAAWADELRAAGRGLAGRSREDTLESLGAVLALWRDPDSDPRRELEARLPPAAGFTREVVRAGLDRALADWDADALRLAVAPELLEIEARDGGGHALTGVVLAGSIPMPSMLALLWPLLLHSPVLAKPASRDPVTAALFARSIAEVDPELGACVRVLPADAGRESAAALVREAECLVASGSDESLAEIAALRAGGRHAASPFVGDGHRISLAAVGAEAFGDELDGIARGLAFDVAAWDQLGCCSPIALFAEGDVGRAAEVAGRVAAALERLDGELPRGEVEAGAAADFAAERAGAEMRIAAGREVSLHGGTSWCVVAEPDAGWRPAPLHRFLRVHPVADQFALSAAIDPVARHLACVAIAGFGDRASEVERALLELGASRVCAPGSLQTPPIGWHHDGRALLLPLARFGQGAPGLAR